MPNYRFHRYVTGNAAIDAVNDIGNGRIACFTSAPGSAGTIAAGDQIKKVFPEAKIAALEPYECSTLANGGKGQHRIEGIGDKMCTLIHNIGTTDFVVLIPDDDCVRGLKVIQDGARVLGEMGIPLETVQSLHDLFGVSCICNILGAIKMAHYLKLGPDDNVVTVASDGFDRYPSVLEDLERRYLETADYVLERWVKDVFLTPNINNVFDFRSNTAKEQLYKQKENDWLPFGYSQEYLDQMRNQSFWDQEYAKVQHYDKEIARLRGL